MHKIIKFFLPFLALASLMGCATFHAEKIAPDGSKLAVDSNRFFIASEVGAIDFGQTGGDTKLTVQGIKSQAQLDALELLKTAASLARP